MKEYKTSLSPTRTVAHSWPVKAVASQRETHLFLFPHPLPLSPGKLLVTLSCIGVPTAAYLMFPSCSPLAAPKPTGVRAPLSDPMACVTYWLPQPCPAFGRVARHHAPILTPMQHVCREVISKNPVIRLASFLSLHVKSLCVLIPEERRVTIKGSFDILHMQIGNVM